MFILKLINQTNHTAGSSTTHTDVYSPYFPGNIMFARGDQQVKGLKMLQRSKYSNIIMKDLYRGLDM